jgi:tetratricopeptide (TPR) repeat protein
MSGSDARFGLLRRAARREAGEASGRRRTLRKRASTMRQFGHRRGLRAGFCLIALWLIAGTARAAEATMFDEGRAQHAFAAIQNKVGRNLRVLTLRITPDELSVGIPNDDKPGEVETWRVSHKGLAGALGVDLPLLEGSARASLPGGGAIAESVIDIDAAGLALVPKLVADALARARFQQPGHATEMELMRLPKFLGPAARDPYWQMHVEAPEEEADISAKLTGEIKNADLSRTKRAENLDLLAGGPDFDEMVQNIRNQMKDQWIFHYIEIEKTAIAFDAHLASLKNPRITRFTATLDDIKTYDVSVPHMTFPGTPADDPFSLADVDLRLLAKLEQSAKDRLQIADGIVQRAILSKPHRENGGAVEWEIEVKSGHAPAFWTPNSPPVEEGSVVFDTKGNVLRVKYPPGRAPQVNLFDPAALQKAIDKIVARLGPHVQVSELVIDDKTIGITAQDPQDPKKFAAFAYADEDVARAADALQTVANAFGAEPNWLWDLALLRPSVIQSLAALERQTMARLGIAHGEIVRITISKDKLFRPGNDKVLIEIRASGDGKDSEWATFDLDGAAPKLEAPVSGIRVVGGGAAQQPTDQDEEDCTRSLDPEKIIPACTKLAEDRSDTPRNRAVAYYDRGNAYKNRQEYDRAVADYSDALKLDPKYAHAYLNRGFSFAAKGDAKSALADLTHAIQLDPSQKLAYFNRGLVYRTEGNYRAAIADYDAAVKLDANFADAYEGRGFAYRLQGDFDRAIADYGEAIKHDPSLAAAYNDRGSAYRLKGDFDRAITDHTQAIQRDPKSSAAYYRRGYVYYLTGAMPKALADLTEANALSPADSYLALLLDIVGRRSALPSRLKDMSARLDMTAWPAPVLRLYMGQMTAEAILAAAADPDPQTRRGRLCEANFYTGELALLNGRKDEATRLFALASGDCPLALSEWESANAELKALGVAPPQGKR